jgi:hypothetical protein
MKMPFRFQNYIPMQVPVLDLMLNSFIKHWLPHATVAGVGQGDGQSTDILPLNTNVLVEDEIQGQSNAGIHEEATPSKNSTGLQANVPSRQESSSGFRQDLTWSTLTSAPYMTPTRAITNHALPREIGKRGDLVF